jgi:hypothetical protein
MNYTQEAIVRAMNSGWNQINSLGVFKGVDAMVLDPLFWQSLGKDQGWADSDKYDDYQKHWLYFWHRFTDHLAEGKDAESFFQELLG